MITLFLNKLKNKLKQQKPWNLLLDSYIHHKYPLDIIGTGGFYQAILIHQLYEISKGSFFVILPSDKDLEVFVRDMSVIDTEINIFPWWDTIPYRSAAPSENVCGKRIEALSVLASSCKHITALTIRSFLNWVLPKEELLNATIHIKKEDILDLQKTAQQLVRMGYSRVPRATVPGEFTLRGEVLDIICPGSIYGQRIIFEFDTIEKIRSFDPGTQETLADLSEMKIHPFQEIIWTDILIDNLETELKKSNMYNSRFEPLFEQLRAEYTCPDQELLYPVAMSKKGSIVDYLGENDHLVFIDQERIERSLDVLNKEYNELFREALRAQHPACRPSMFLHDFEDLVQRSEKIVRFPSIHDPQKDKNRIAFQYTGPRSFFGNIQYLKGELTNLIDSGYDITIFAESHTQKQRIEHLLQDLDISIVADSISHGFTIPDVKIIAIQENEIFGRRKHIAASVKKAKSRGIDTFVELNPGDFIVHINYGIGKFMKIERIKAAGTERDYIQLLYADEETVFIPIEQVNLIQRYIGNEGRPPKLDKLGGKSWSNRKSKVRKSVEDLADHLIDVYSRRKTAQGFAYPVDTDWQIEFEAAFPYEETEDQLVCIEDVKRDMESPRPMDRLICGDVGYGKTEVAMRAAFKAVISGKQVALLAPTTILAEQHFENFSERFERYPVKLEMISRFVSKSKQKEIIKRAASGEVDLLIGTHRILQKDINFKNLGLLIIDEEQRFGVKHKERMKDIKSSIDCLSLSATPIPRTLHMSLLKIRDMSLLTTPPYNRRPIETYIREFNHDLVCEAIRNEMERGGQVFYLHNRVETLNDVRIFLEKLMPEVLIETAHGQMTSSELEDIMHRFIKGAFQVLVATTIIENGIDIPNVNTIIIDRADMYGISQLYQLRGRVGRSNRKAYSYLFYPGEKSLSELAMKRLRIISDYTDLGSGFKIAMKDLEVRGAGNLLGRQQHGDILSVGFDMYLKILDQAIAEKSDLPEEQPPEVFLELEYSGFIPDEYIDDPTEKMDMYKKITSVSEEGDLTSLAGELQDKYGPLPEVAMSLLAISEIRIICRRLFISSLRERKGIARIEFARVSVISADKVMRLIKESGGMVTIDQQHPHILIIKTGQIGLHEKSEFIREKLQFLI